MRISLQLQLHVLRREAANDADTPDSRYIRCCPFRLSFRRSHIALDVKRRRGLALWRPQHRTEWF